jgi:hypothetical protein
MTDRFDKFTDKARRVLTLAQAESLRFNHNYLGTEHLLLGLLRVDDGVAAKVLTNLGVEPNKVRSAVEFIIGRGEKSPRGEIGLTPSSKRVIELAVEEARRLNHSYIGTEHLLLGMVREGEGIAFGVLESLGVSLERVRTETARVLSGASMGPPRAASAEGAAHPGLEDALRKLDAARKLKDQALAAQQYELAAELRQRELDLEQTIELMRTAFTEFTSHLDLVIGERPPRTPEVFVESHWAGWLGTLGGDRGVEELLALRYHDGWRLVAVQHGIGFWGPLVPRGRTRYIWERPAPAQPPGRSEPWDIPPIPDDLPD